MIKIYSFKFQTPFGPFCLTATPRGLYSCDVIAIHAKGGAKQSQIPSGIHSLLKQAAREVSSYLRGRKVNFRPYPVDWSGLGSFERRVLQELRRIPWGRTQSYQFLAAKTGKPKAARAVGGVLHRNRLPFIVPCHRIIPKRGGWGGFSRGVEWKKRLLKIERVRADTKSRSTEWGKC